MATPTGNGRILADLRGAEPGPTLVCFAGMHGNEPAGVEAVGRVSAALEEQGLPRTGEFVALLGNREACRQGVRFVDRDLNRVWADEHRTEGSEPMASEEREREELAEEFERVVERARGPLHALDIHTTSGSGGAFVVAADTLPNREFARGLAAPLVLGLEERIRGTLTEYLSDRGFVTAVFEAGQHGDRGSVDRAEAALWLALAGAELVPASHGRVTAARDALSSAARTLPRVLAVRHRYEVEDPAGFTMKPGYENFRPIREGEELAEHEGRCVTAPESGRILMPLYQKQGNDGFFVVREFRPFWLGVSEALRRVGADRLLHLLPGVSRSDEFEGAIVLDRRRARWYALEIVHLLGFRKVEEEDERLLVVRRRFDRG